VNVNLFSCLPCLWSFQANGIGVENLRGSGLIAGTHHRRSIYPRYRYAAVQAQANRVYTIWALLEVYLSWVWVWCTNLVLRIFRLFCLGETSRAYDETFTLSFVTGRSVGIGAYLNRLGQRYVPSVLLFQFPWSQDTCFVPFRAYMKCVCLSLRISLGMHECIASSSPRPYTCTKHANDLEIRLK